MDKLDELQDLQSERNRIMLHQCILNELSPNAAGSNDMHELRMRLQRKLSQIEIQIFKLMLQIY